LSAGRRDGGGARARAVAEGVHRIPLPLPNDGLRAVNVYAITDGSGLTLIDSGWALTEARQRLEAALASIGHELGDVRRFLVTHVHRDHYTLAITVRRVLGSRVLPGAGEQQSREHATSPGQRGPDVHYELLLRRGWTEADCALLASGNILRVLREAEKLAVIR